jgi:hypothetical protein
MHRSPILISCIVAICLVTHGSLSYGQEQSVTPYFGLSGGLAVDGGPGWGIEAGIHFLTFYAGLEYGISYPLPTSINYDPSIGGIGSPYSISNEQFWGVHMGYVFPRDSINHNSICLGVVIMKSYQMWDIPTSEFSSVTKTKSYLSVGPDFRISDIDNGHIYIDLAFTIWRIWKAGIGYTL